MPSIEAKDDGSTGAAKDDLIVRGRTFDQSKPETFNQVTRLQTADISLHRK